MELCYKYVFKDNEKEFIEKNFLILYINNYCVYYKFNTKFNRKIKIFFLQKDKRWEIYNNIITSSIVSNSVQVLTNQLSDELAKEIDKRILEDIKRL